jgi:uncharacterized lipoprotein YehR (DUF1307 family)
MKVNKKITTVLSSILLITALTACGSTDTSGTEPKKVVNGANAESPTIDDKNPGIVAGEISVNLEETIKEGKLTYLFTLKNDKEQNEVLQYSSSQQYEYQLIDSTGNVAYTYSMDKMFLQSQSEQTVKPGETLTFEIDLSEDLKNLKPGTYQFVVWSTASDREDLKAKAEFNWGGEGEGLEETKGKLAGATVTFIGLMDQNSIEVINENGETDHFRLSDTVKPAFESLVKDTKITIHYGMTSDGQKIIEEVIAE